MPDEALQYSTDAETVTGSFKARDKEELAWLKKQARRARISILTVVACGFVNGLGVIVQAALLALVLHRVIVEKAAADAVLLPLVCLPVIYLARSLCTYFAETAGFSAAAKIRSAIRRELMNKMLDLGPAWIANRQSGALACIAIEQVEALDPYFSRYLPQQLLVLLIPIAMLIVIFPVNWLVALILAVAGPLVPLFMILIGAGAEAANRRHFLSLARMGAHFLDRLQGMTTLKLFGQTERELEMIAHVADSHREKTMGVLRIAFLSSAILEFFSAIVVAMVAVYVGLTLLGMIHFGPSDSVTLFTGLFVLLLAPEFFLPLRQLAVHYHDRAAALAAAEDILDILTTADKEVIHPVIPSAVTAEKSLAISFEQICFSYGRKHLPILDKLSFEISPGEKVALTGPSGAGKSTVVKLLLGFEKPDAGRILIKPGSLTGKASAMAHETILRHIAWVGQAPYLFHGSIRDNIRLGCPEADDKAVVRAANAAQLTEFSDTLPNRLDTVIGEQGYGLSGGQAQRVALARAFIRDAPLLVLDEPTANLDARNVSLILETLDEILADRTVIIVTHNADVIARTDRQILMQRGRGFEGQTENPGDP